MTRRVAARKVEEQARDRLLTLNHLQIEFEAFTLANAAPGRNYDLLIEGIDCVPNI